MARKHTRRHIWRGHAVVLLTTACVVGIRWPAEQWLGEGIPMLLSGLPVLISAFVGGLWPGLMATLLNLLIGIFFVEPIHIFDVDHFADRLRASLFVMEGVIISVLCEALHRARGKTQILLEREQDAREQAEEGIRTKDKFLATVSHELRTPLSAIVGWAELLDTGTLDPAQAKEAIETIRRNARVQTKLVEDLLEMSRLSVGQIRLEIEAFPMQEVLDAALETLRPAAEAKEITLQKRVSRELGLVNGDPFRLQQVFWNLLSNAIKFTPRGGLVELTAERVKSRLEVCVRDTGDGIDPEFLPHVFEQFRQANQPGSQSHGGLGLGLSIVKKLVELHGGTANVSSAGLGQGATFTVSLPVPAVWTEPAVESVEHSDSAVTSGLGEAQRKLAGLRVLVVDDEPDARRVISEMLAACGTDVVAASSGDEALQLIQRTRPDLLVSDILMPDQDGYEFLRNVRQLESRKSASIPAVALTALARPEDHRQAIRSGFQVHVSKPVQSDELVEVLAGLAQIKE